MNTLGNGGSPSASSSGSPSSSVVTVQGIGATSTVNFTRPENTTAYTALDVIGIADSGTPANAGSAIHTFTSAGPSGGVVFITGWDLTIDLTAVPSGMSSFNLDIYDASPTAILDNAAYDLVTADQAKHLVRLDAVTPADLGSSLFAGISNLNYQVKLASGVTSLYGILSTNGGYTPASATRYRVRIRTIAA